MSSENTKGINCVVTDLPVNGTQQGTMFWSNSQYQAQPSRLEGFNFNTVVFLDYPDPEMEKWFRMHLGFRVKQMIYAI